MPPPQVVLADGVLGADDTRVTLLVAGDHKVESNNQNLCFGAAQFHQPIPQLARCQGADLEQGRLTGGQEHSAGSGID